MKHTHQFIASMAAISTLAASTAMAQGYSSTEASDANYNDSSYILPNVSRVSPEDKFGTSKSATGGGIRFGKPVSPHWDMQLGLQYGRINDGANRLEQLTLGLDGLYLFSRSRFRPLLLVGVGAERDEFRTPTGKASSTSPFAGVGAGLQFSFSDQWGMQLDARRNYAFLRGNSFGTKRANTDVVSLGLMYSFEKTPQPAPRVAQAPAYVAPPAPVAAPAPQLPPPIIIVSPPAPPTPMPPRFERMTISASKLFNFDSSELRTPMPKLDEVADALAKFPDASNVMITGYTDRLGSETYNLTLSQKRADSVKSYLVNRGVAANRMTATGKGESNPVANCTEKNLAKLIECLESNRRVEVEQITIERRVP